MRLNKRYDTRLMVKCAQMYYEEKMNQQSISKKLQISKSSVSRILSSARKEGIVKIVVENPLKNQYLELEKKLEQKFNLTEVIIVDSKVNNADEMKKELGKACAEYLQRIIKDEQIIGVTWGTTLKYIPNYVENNKRNKVTFIPLLGGIGDSTIDIHPNQIVLKLAQKFRSNYKLLYAPFIVDDYRTKEVFIKDRNVQSFFKLIDKVDIGIMGIGNPLLNSSTLLESGYFTFKDIEELKKKEAVGDISSLFVDKNGKGDFFESNKRIIGINLEQIRNIPINIGVAGHQSKKKAIFSILKGKYINVLITDEITAQGLLYMN